MTASILVPLDGSTAAEAVLPYAVTLAARMDAEILLFRAVYPLAATTTAGLPPILTTGAEVEARKYLVGVRDDLRQRGARASLHVRLEGAVPAILDESEAPGVSMVAMATHGRTGLAHLLLGGTCEAVLRESKAPVFAVRPFPPAGIPPAEAPGSEAFRTILVPVDGTPQSLSILPQLCAFAKVFGSELIFLHVLEPRKAALAAVGRQDRTRAEEEAPALESAVRRCEVQGVRSSIDIDFGEVPDRILEVCRSRNVDLIAMATYGRSGLSSLLLGSVPAEILKRTEVPLLFCRQAP